MAKDKKKDGKKVEKPVCSPISVQDTAAESSSTKLTDLQMLVNGAEETQANAVIPLKDPEEAEEPPVQDVPQYCEEAVLTQVGVKRYACYKYASEVKNAHLSISGVPSVIQTRI